MYKKLAHLSKKARTKEERHELYNEFMDIENQVGPIELIDNKIVSLPLILNLINQVADSYNYLIDFRLKHPMLAPTSIVVNADCLENIYYFDSYTFTVHHNDADKNETILEYRIRPVYKTGDSTDGCHLYRVFEIEFVNQNFDNIYFAVEGTWDSWDCNNWNCFYIVQPVQVLSANFALYDDKHGIVLSKDDMRLSEIRNEDSKDFVVVDDVFEY